MAAGSYTTEALVSSVRRRAKLPATDDGTSFPRDSDLIAMANEEMVAFLVPWILKAREGHFITTSLTQRVSGQAQYTIPSRAVGDDISLVSLTDSLGNPTFPGLVEADLEIAVQYPYTSAAFGQPTRYFFQGNNVTLIPTPTDSSIYLQFYYPQRPNQLVAATAVGAITGVTQVGGNFQVAYTGSPAGFVTAVAYECVHSNPGFEVVILGTANGTGSGYIQFPGTIPTGINVGDELCLQDMANVMTNVPADLFGLFAQHLACKVAEFNGDEGRLERALAGFKVSEKIAREFLGRRDALGHRKISAATSRYGRRPLYFAK